jgi:hypothetical protein
MFAIALLVVAATTSEIEAVAGRSTVDAANYEESCRAYANRFLEAVKTRQATSIREDGIDRQRALEILDAQIDAFNNLIASQCGGS